MTGSAGWSLSVTSVRWSRRSVHGAALLLAARVLLDLATPLLPGAFGLDPSVSIAAATTSHHVAVNPAATLPPSTGRSTGVTSRSSESAVRRRDLHVARPMATPASSITHVPERVAASPPSEDH
jgi:hypothetical protein